MGVVFSTRDTRPYRIGRVSAIAEEVRKMIEAPKIIECYMLDCAYNTERQCHANAITVGGGGCPLCDTALKSAKKGGHLDATGSVGACKVDNCQFNDSLECSAGGIRVTMHEKHAECGTFKARK